MTPQQEAAEAWAAKGNLAGDYFQGIEDYKASNPYLYNEMAKLIQETE